METQVRIIRELINLSNFVAELSRYQAKLISVQVLDYNRFVVTFESTNKYWHSVGPV